MPALHVNNGPEAGKKYDLTLPEYILGRHPECTIVIDVGAVSRHHCKVFKDAQIYWVEDLKSRNGTFVNETQIAGKQRLNDGDQVRVCDVSFTFKGDVKAAVPNAFGPFTPKLDESSFRAVLVDDPEESIGSTIMSKLDVRSGRSGAMLAASAEAKLQALIEITQSLGRAVSLDAVLPQVLESLFRIFVQADRGFIGLIDKESGKLIPLDQAASSRQRRNDSRQPHHLEARAGIERGDPVRRRGERFAVRDEPEHRRLSNPVDDVRSARRQ